MPSHILTIPVTTQTPVIPLTVQSGDRIPFHVDDASAIPFKLEAVQIIQAISPTVDAERNEEGVLITITDYRGGQQMQLYDLGNDIILDGGDADG